jgi:hypothetical protein
MPTTPAERGTFEKVGECFYRYSSTGTYYAVLRHRGKLIRKGLETSDRAPRGCSGLQRKRDWSIKVKKASQWSPATEAGSRS